MQTFIITLTINGYPVIFHFVRQEGEHCYRVSPLNNKSFEAFNIERQCGQWVITSPIEGAKVLEAKLSPCIDAYLDGQGRYTGQPSSN